MRRRARRDLRGVGHGEHLRPPGEAREALADGVGHRAADARVDLVEHQRRRRAAIGQHDFQRQHEARKFAARGDFGQRAGPRAGIGLHPELDAVDPLRPAVSGIARRPACEKCAPSSFSGFSSASTSASSFFAAFCRAAESARAAAS